MINVYPTLKLVAAYIFRDSKGNRLMLRPAGTMEDVENAPQEFDESDPKVAEMLLERASSKEIKISATDKKLLKNTIIERDAEAEGKARKGFISLEDHQRAVEAAVAKALAKIK